MILPKSDFQKSCRIVVYTFEGGDKLVSDTGGMTKWGISKRAFPSEMIVTMSYEQAEALYKKHYWDRCRCDELPAPLAFLVFDCAVNQGTSVAVKCLQRAVDQSADGVLGPKTMSSVAAMSNKEKMHKLLVDFQTERVHRYLSINNKAEEAYERGWMARLLNGLVIAMTDFPMP